MITYLEALIDEHRGKGIVCPPQCFCWDVESFLSKSITEAKPELTVEELNNIWEYEAGDLTEFLHNNFHITRREG